MVGNRALAVCIGLVAILGGLPLASAQLDDTPWPMFQGGPDHTGRSSYVGPQEDQVRCSLPMDAGMAGIPVLARDGVVYLPTGDIEDGNEGKAYLRAIRADCTEAWAYRLPGGPGLTAPAIASDGTIYVHVNGGGGNQVAVEQLVALDPGGTHKWTFEFNDGAGSFTSSRQSSPALAPDGTIWVGSMNTFLHALNPDGTIKCVVSPSVSSMTASPAIASDGTVYITDSMNLTAVDPADCGIVWSRSFGISGHAGSPSIGDDGTIYIAGSERVGGTTSDHLFAFNPDGTIRWRFPLGRSSDSTPAIGGEGTIYVAADGLYAVNPDGSLAWHEGCWSSSSSSNSAPIVGADGTIYWMQAFSHCAHAADGTLKWKSSVDSAPPTLQYSGTIGPEGTLYFPEGPGPGGDTVALRAYATPPAPPTNPTLSSPSHQVRAWSTDGTVDVTWSGASDEDGSVDGYSYVWDTVSGTNPDTVQDAHATASGTTSPPLKDGDSHYFHLRTVDDEGLWSDAVHLGPFWIEADAKRESDTEAPVVTSWSWDRHEVAQGEAISMTFTVEDPSRIMWVHGDVLRVGGGGHFSLMYEPPGGFESGTYTVSSEELSPHQPGTWQITNLQTGDEWGNSRVDRLEGASEEERTFTLEAGDEQPHGNWPPPPGPLAEEVAPLPIRTQAGSAFTDGRYVYHLGGCVCGETDTEADHHDEVFRYDPVTGTWETMGARVERIGGADGVALVGRTAYLFGGGTDVALYDLDRDETTLLPDVLPAGYGRAFGVVEYDGRHIWLVGGFDGDPSGPEPTEIVRFNPHTHEAEVVGELPRFVFNTAGVYDGRHIWSFGGNSGTRETQSPENTEVADVIQVDTRSGHASFKDPLDQACTAPAAAFDGRYAWVFGPCVSRDSEVLRVDTTTGEYRLIQGVPGGTFGHFAAATYIEPYVYVIGGGADGQPWTDRVVRFDPRVVEDEDPEPEPHPVRCAQAPPRFVSVTPSEGSTVTHARPTITARYEDGDGHSSFELDGVERDAGFGSDSVRFTPDFDLAYGAHTVTVTISNCNDTTSKSWTFTIQQRPESREKTDDEQAHEHRGEPGRGGSSPTGSPPSADARAEVETGARLSLNDADGGEWRIAGAEHGARVNGTLTLSLESSDGREARAVEWRIDGQLEARRSSAPYWFVVDTQGDADGEHIIEAEIHEQNEENGDEVSTSVEITLVFENWPPGAAVPSPGVGLMALAMVAAVLLKTDRPRKGRPRPSDCNSI